MEVENLILLSTQVLLRSNEPWRNFRIKRAHNQQQSIEHSYMVVSRKYAKLNWQNSTQVFSTNPCFLQKTVYDVSGDI